ncbi:MAG: PHP domain-containing protein, partial [Candidatus Bathyarchaeia archaeon]
YSPLKIDFHVHTCYSYDSKTTLREVLTYARRKKLNGIAVVDHDTVEGALKLSKICRKTEFIVIPGLEIKSTHAHLIALNVEDRIKSGMSALETLDAVHESGGFAVLSHPFSLFKGSSLKLKSLVEKIDAIEVMNSCAIPFFFSVYAGRRYAKYLKIPEVAGSDAHIPEVIGSCYCEVHSGPNIEEILEAIRRGKVTSFGSGISIHKRLKTILKGRTLK